MLARLAIIQPFEDANLVEKLTRGQIGIDAQILREVAQDALDRHAPFLSITIVFSNQDFSIFSL